MMKYQVLIIFMLSTTWSCFGPVDPSHPLDEDSPRNIQAQASLRLTLTMPAIEERQGYISLLSSHSNMDMRRLYLEDFNFKGTTFDSDGESRMVYSYVVSNLEPGIYAFYSYIPNFQLKAPSLFQLNPNSDLSLAIELESTP